jgi:hypothetical protein
VNDRPLKAREIEALTFIYPAWARPPAALQARSTLRRWPIPAGVAGLVLLGALAWCLFPG